MKKITVALLLALSLLAAPVFAQQFTVDGEVKTGVLWRETQDTLGLNEEPPEIRLGSMDDAGSGFGRFRVNMEYVSGVAENMGFKTRLNWENWSVNNPRAPDFPYAFGYGNFFDDQLTLSAGLLGSSPWGTGGPIMWKELENTRGGMRFEYKPHFVPGDLNIGFVLNSFNSPHESSNEVKSSFMRILEETVLGVSYTMEDYFHVRFAFRFDSPYDQRLRGVTDGNDLLYRVEERMIQRYLPGFQMWAMGFFEGVGSDSDESHTAQNWFIIEYAPDLFLAQLRTGLDVTADRILLYFRPRFDLNLFDRFIVIGAEFQYGQDFGDGKVNDKAPYSHLEVQPKIVVNFSPNTAFGFMYNWRREYVREMEEHRLKGVEALKQRQWMNLFMTMTF